MTRKSSSVDKHCVLAILFSLFLLAGYHSHAAEIVNSEGQDTLFVSKYICRDRLGGMKALGPNDQPFTFFDNDSNADLTAASVLTSAPPGYPMQEGSDQDGSLSLILSKSAFSSGVSSPFPTRLEVDDNYLQAGKGATHKISPTISRNTQTVGTDDTSIPVPGGSTSLLFGAFLLGLGLIGNYFCTKKGTQK